MTGAVMNWADTAELYWKFVGDGWSADSDDVEMEVCFANAAAGTAAVKGDNFRAWGHGPLTGDVSLDEDEPMVTYTIPCVHQANSPRHASPSPATGCHAFRLERGAHVNDRERREGVGRRS